jgi:hypothetical protein
MMKIEIEVTAEGVQAVTKHSDWAGSSTIFRPFKEVRDILDFVDRIIRDHVKYSLKKKVVRKRGR